MGGGGGGREKGEGEWNHRHGLITHSSRDEVVCVCVCVCDLGHFPPTDIGCCFFFHQFNSYCVHQSPEEAFSLSDLFFLFLAWYFFFLFSLLFLILIDLFEFCCCEPAVMRALRNTPPASYCFSFLSQIRLEQTIIVFVSDMWRNVYRHALTHTHTHTHTLLLFQIMARCGWK